jgi:flagellar hook protein FlgE
MRFYDADGNSHQATIYFDATPLPGNGQRIFEFVVGIDPELDHGPQAGTAGAGLVMAGTLTFSSNGELINMSAFTPNGGDAKDLNNWIPAALSGGVPQGVFYVNGQGAQQFTLDLGISSTTGAWINPPASAAAIGTDHTLIPYFQPQLRTPESTTSFSGASTTKLSNQDGWALGYLNNMHITENGMVRCYYTNGQDYDVYSIPIFRFTSEDGLHREGKNLFSATKDSGAMQYGEAGTENYGKVYCNYIETSNVELSREMVHMIILQRGFQMNSKTITTADTMLQRALELKR